MQLNFETTSYNKDGKRAEIGLLVGKIGDDYYFCDDIFKYKGGFKGATATILTPITQGELDDRWDEEHMRELWEMAVSSGNTDDGLTDWVEWVKDMDGEESQLDGSGSQYYPQLRALGISEDDYPYFTCTGGGRAFSKGMKWDELYNPELWALIQKYEN